jgi:hypothetical protein
MVEGSVQKYLKEVSLFDQVFVKAADGKQTVGAYLKAREHPSRASPSTWWAMASRRRWMTSPPRWPLRSLPPKGPDALKPIWRRS